MVFAVLFYHNLHTAFTTEPSSPLVHVHFIKEALMFTTCIHSYIKLKSLKSNGVFPFLSATGESIYIQRITTDSKSLCITSPL